MRNSLSTLLCDIYMHFFECALFEKFPFPFWVHYVDDIFTLISISTPNINCILKLMNSINNNIQFAFEINNINSLSFLDTMVSHNEEGFSTTVYRKLFAIYLPSHPPFLPSPPPHKMAAFNTYVSCALN